MEKRTLRSVLFQFLCIIRVTQESEVLLYFSTHYIEEVFTHLDVQLTIAINLLASGGIVVRHHIINS